MNHNHSITMHLIKHAPKDGEVYITLNGETFKGYINDISIRTRIDEPTTFDISGFVAR